MASNDFIGSMETMDDGGRNIGQVDRYFLKSKLGQGGFGAVYLAHDSVSHIDVALKTLPGELCNNEDEMKKVRDNFALVSKLHHPNIAPLLHIHEIEQADTQAQEALQILAGDCLLVMAYVQGSTLTSWLELFPSKKLPFEVACEVCSQVAGALDYAHSEQVVHRDIKPGNIIIDGGADDFKVKVLDFGLAAEIRSSMSRVSQDTGRTSGTRPYMAPEQWAGKSQGSFTDQYALAVMLYELIKGEVPFKSVFDTGDTSIMARVVEEKEVEPLAELTKTQNKVLLQALAKDPQQRFSSCGDFIAALSGKATVIQNERSSSGRLFKAAIWFVLLLVLAGSGYAFWNTKSQIVETNQVELKTETASVQTPASKPKEVSTVESKADTPVESVAKVLKTIKAVEPVVKAEKVDEPVEIVSKAAEMDFESGASFAVEMVKVEAGSYKMGAGKGTHAVTISKPYWIGKYEVTNRQYKYFIITSEYYGAPDTESFYLRHLKMKTNVPSGENYPVCYISWKNANAFCKWLTEKEHAAGNLPEGYVYRLPTEAEWEFAARGGNKSKGYKYSGSNDVEAVAWYQKNSNNKAHPVGQKQANELGIHDMSGNVFEWCLDYCDYKSGVITDTFKEGIVDPLCKTGPFRLLRGGAYGGALGYVTPVYRVRNTPIATSYNFGFRVVLGPDLSKSDIDVRKAEVISQKATTKKFKTWKVPDVGMQFVRVSAMPCWVGKYEVTNGEYRKFKPSHISKSYQGQNVNEDRQPVTYVGYKDALAYAEWLTKKERTAKRLSNKWCYRLPTEEEWLQFAQCGDNRKFPWGNNWPPQSGKAGNYGDVTRSKVLKGGMPGYDDGYAVVAPVEKSWMNDWGLYGVGGNVWECCVDNKTKSTFTSWKGGAWSNVSRNDLSCSARNDTNKTASGIGYGFRLVLAKVE